MANTTGHVVAIRASRPLYVAGWAGIAVFAALDVMAQGSKDLPYAVVVCAVALALGTWYQVSTGRAALVVGLIVGTLFALGQIAYLAADLGPGDDSFWRTTLIDAVGLGAALLILVGGLLGLRRRDRFPA